MSFFRYISYSTVASISWCLGISVFSFVNPEADPNLPQTHLFAFLCFFESECWPKGLIFFWSPSLILIFSFFLSLFLVLFDFSFRFPFCFFLILDMGCFGPSSSIFSSFATSLRFDLGWLLKVYFSLHRSFSSGHFGARLYIAISNGPIFNMTIFMDFKRIGIISLFTFLLLASSSIVLNILHWLCWEKLLGLFWRFNCFNWLNFMKTFILSFVLQVLLIGCELLPILNNFIAESLKEIFLVQ